MSSTTLTATSTFAEETQSFSELEKAALFLQQAQSGLTGALKGLSDAQWVFKPAPDCWSIAEIVEHIVFVQERVLGPVREQLLNAGAPPDGYDSKVVDEIVLNQFPNRLAKYPSPHQPFGHFAKGAALDQLARNYGRFTQFLKSTPNLRRHALQSPPLKAVSNGVYESMDGYQWILAAAAHTERHTKQILEVKADANFPPN